MISDDMRAQSGLEIILLLYKSLVLHNGMQPSSSLHGDMRTKQYSFVCS